MKSQLLLCIYNENEIIFHCKRPYSESIQMKEIFDEAIIVSNFIQALFRLKYAMSWLSCCSKNATSKICENN